MKGGLQGIGITIASQKEQNKRLKRGRSSEDVWLHKETEDGISDLPKPTANGDELFLCAWERRKHD
jgi:hypothetical protein